MSLIQYCRSKRMVVLKPSASAHEAARALDHALGRIDDRKGR